MAVHDRLEKEKRLKDFKKQGNKIKSLVRSAKKSSFDKLIESNKKYFHSMEGCQRNNKQIPQENKQLHYNHFP